MRKTRITSISSIVANVVAMSGAAISTVDEKTMTRWTFATSVTSEKSSNRRMSIAPMKQKTSDSWQLAANRLSSGRLNLMKWKVGLELGQKKASQLDPQQAQASDRSWVA
jgi:flagellar basal body-associated protein FliL